jgi:ABC-type antimicrobial peptide transport system permease subunit
VGRTFIPEDGIAGHEQVVVLSYQFWRRQFGGDPSVVGQKILTDGLPYIVIGVMPRNFSFPELKPELWIPEVLVRDENSKGGRYLTVVARLKPGITLQQAQQDMISVAKTTAQLRPEFNKDWSANVVPMLEDATLRVSRPLWVLLAAVGFLLLLACANVANLLLMRGTGRMREIAVRCALGADRARIVQQLLAESLLLSFAGMATGLLFAGFGLRGPARADTSKCSTPPQRTDCDRRARICVYISRYPVYRNRVWLDPRPSSLAGRSTKSALARHAPQRSRRATQPSPVLCSG